MMRLALVGDVMLGRLVNRALRRLPPGRIWGDAPARLREADARICNLECALSDRGERAPKEFAFRADPRHVSVLSAAAIDAVCLANNHTLDYGPEALADTVATLDRAGIAHAGAGATTAEARAPAVVRAGGMTLALLSVTDNEPRWEAGPNRPGVWYVPVEGSDPRVAALRVAVTETRNRAGIDLVIVAAHWGTNWGYRPEPGHREVAHALLDAGAGIVYGHSSHVARGIETRRGGAILYGAGDFIDDYVVDEVEPNDEAFLFVAEWSGARLEGLRAYPFLIRAFRPTRAEGPRRDAMTRRMVSLCGELATAAVWDESEGALRVAAANDVRDPLPRGVHVDDPLRERDLDPLVREPPV